MKDSPWPPSQFEPLPSYSAHSLQVTYQSQSISHLLPLTCFLSATSLDDSFMGTEIFVPYSS